VIDLDIGVAEKVMGWTRFEGKQIPLSVTNTEVWSGEPHCKRVWAKQNANGRWTKMACQECGDLPNFSDDPGWALQAYEILKERGWRISGASDLAGWRVSLTKLRHESYGYGEPFARALCEAMVVAVGVDTEEKAG
jgi:hypothetical protein